MRDVDDDDDDDDGATGFFRFCCEWVVEVVSFFASFLFNDTANVQRMVNSTCDAFILYASSNMWTSVYIFYFHFTDKLKMRAKKRKRWDARTQKDDNKSENKYVCLFCWARISFWMKRAHTARQQPTQNRKQNWHYICDELGTITCIHMRTHRHWPYIAHW